MSTRESGGRAQSNPIAVVLILATVLIAATAAAALGTITLDAGRELAETQRGEYAMSQFDSQASATALDGAGRQKVDLSPSGDATVGLERQGWMSVVLIDTTDGTKTKVLDKETFGTVVHRSGDQVVGFQAGGVWRTAESDDGSVMVTPPELHYTGQTLTLPFIEISGSTVDASTLQTEKVGTTRVFPDGNPSNNISNPVSQDHDLLIVVQSRFYRAWHQFFETRIGGDVYYPKNTDSRVAVRLTASQVNSGVITGGLISLGTSEVVKMGGTGGRPAFIDSYNSSVGPYEDSKSDKGSVKTASGINLFGNAHINGTVDTGGPVSLDGADTRIFGNAAHQGIDHPEKVTGWEAKNGSAPSVPPIDQLVADAVDEIEADNDNGPTECVNSKNQFALGGNVDTVTCEEGSYYVGGNTKLKKGEEIVIDLSKGNVSLALDGDLTLQPGSKITVKIGKGENVTKVWFDGDAITLKDNVTVPGDRAPQLQVLGSSSTTVDMQSESQFVGVIYAPTTSTGSALKMQTASDIYGAAVVGEVDMEGGSRIHYDRALAGLDIIQRDNPTASQLSYLHVTDNEIRVSD